MYGGEEHGAYILTASRTTTGRWMVWTPWRGSRAKQKNEDSEYPGLHALHPHPIQRTTEVTTNTALALANEATYGIRWN